MSSDLLDRVLHGEPVVNLLSGHHASEFVETGFIFCPYVPLTQTPVVLDPNSFNPREGLTTRYSRELLEEGQQFYGRIIIDGQAVNSTPKAMPTPPLNWKEYGF